MVAHSEIAVAGRAHLQVAAERTADRVGVRGVGVVVHRVGAGGRQVGVGRDRRVRDRLLRRRRTGEGLAEQVGGQRRDRRLDRQRVGRGTAAATSRATPAANVDRTTRVLGMPGQRPRDARVTACGSDLILVTALVTASIAPSTILGTSMPSGFIGCSRASVPPSAKTTEPTSRLASLGEQEGDQRRDLLGAPGPVERGRVGVREHPELGVLAQLLGHRGGDQAGCHRVHPDAGAGPLGLDALAAWPSRRARPWSRGRLHGVLRSRPAGGPSPRRRRGRRPRPRRSTRAGRSPSWS